MRVLFSLLILSLFIPTNYPSLIEAIIALPLGLLLLRHSRSNPQKTLPDKTDITLWVFTLITLAVGSFFSRSSSLSLITLIRYVEGFAIYTLASTYPIHPVSFSRRMAAFGLLSCAAFIIILISIYPLRITPYYNSLTGINGHHPVAYTIIMTVPFIIAAAKRKTILMRLVILGISLILSAARGAWIMTAIFFSSQTIPLLPAIRRSQKIINTNGNQIRHNLPMIATLIFLIIALVIAGYITTLSDAEKEKVTKAAPAVRLYIKDTNMVMRLAFAGQAMAALRESPLVGHGPGTFSLLSRQYQTRSSLFSQFAHSFPLETLAENGILGSIGIAALFLLILTRALRTLQSENTAPFGWAVILTMLYSVIEVNLNSLPHWLIFWLIAGTLTRSTMHNHIPRFRNIAILMGIILVLFSLSYLTAQTYIAGKNTKKALTMAPYDKSVAIRRITQAPSLNKTEIHLIQRWHSLDPDILVALSPYKTELLPLALEKDPQNTHYRKEYITRLLTRGDTAAIAGLLCKTPEGVADAGCPLKTSKPFSVFIKDKIHAMEALNHLIGDDGYAKFLYFFGVALYTYTGDTLGTTYLWQKAQEAAPHWAYYYLEVAGAQYYWLNDTSAAEKTIAVCMQHPLAANGCKLVTDIHTLLRPGLYSRDIIIIPALQ